MRNRQTWILKNARTIGGRNDNSLRRIRQGPRIQAWRIVCRNWRRLQRSPARVGRSGRRHRRRHRRQRWSWRWNGLGLIGRTRSDDARRWNRWNRIIHTTGRATGGGWHHRSHRSLGCYCRVDRAISRVGHALRLPPVARAWLHAGDRATGAGITGSDRPIGRDWHLCPVCSVLGLRHVIHNLPLAGHCAGLAARCRHVGDLLSWLITVLAG